MPPAPDSNPVRPIQGRPLPEQEKSALTDLVDAYERLVVLTGERPTARVLRNVAQHLENRA